MLAQFVALFAQVQWARVLIKLKVLVFVIPVSRHLSIIIVIPIIGTLRLQFLVMLMIIQMTQ